MRPTRIFLDLDDVLNDFTMHALREVGCPVWADHWSSYNPAWGWDIVGAANHLHPNAHRNPFTPESFWTRITSTTWITTPRSDLFMPLIRRCRKLVGEGGVCILTSPTIDPECHSAKAVWIKKHCPAWLQRQYLIGPPKHMCANHNAVLIDDRNKNIEEFRNHGGHAIMVPRPWNTLYALTRKARIYVDAALDAIFI